MCACVLCCAVLLLLMGSVLCVERCGGVRRARAVRVCVSESRVDLCVQRARRRVLCAVLCCAPCLCGCEAQPWLGGLRGGLRRAAGGCALVRWCAAAAQPARAGRRRPGARECGLRCM